MVAFAACRQEVLCSVAATGELVIFVTDSWINLGLVFREASSSLVVQLEKLMHGVWQSLLIH